MDRRDDGRREVEALAAAFREMLERCSRAYDLGAAVALGERGPGDVRRELFATDAAINLDEQGLRQRLLVHASIGGAPAVPTCLVFMSIAKDAERIGDYAKNLYDVGARHPITAERAWFDELSALRSRISRTLRETAALFESQDESRAREFIRRVEHVEDACDEVVDGAVERRLPDSRDGVAAALTARYMKRIAAHAKNIVSSIVMPVDKLDFPDGR